MSDVNHENEIEELKRKLLTNELMTGILMVNIVRVLDKLAPAGNATESILSVLRQGQEKIPETAAKNDHHTIDAFAKAIKLLETASKK